MFSVALAGCGASFMYGATRRAAMDRYMLVDEAAATFGYRRLQYNLGHHRRLQGFVAEHGIPDLIHEYWNEKGREAIAFFYVKRDVVYFYEAQSWLPDSLELKQQRPLTEDELATYKALVSRQQLTEPPADASSCCVPSNVRAGWQVRRFAHFHFLSEPQRVQLPRELPV